MVLNFVARKDVEVKKNKNLVCMDKESWCARGALFKLSEHVMQRLKISRKNFWSKSNLFAF